MEFLKIIIRHISHRYILNKGARISFWSKVSKDSKVGKGSIIFDNARLGSVKVGTNTYIGENSIFERTTIGNFCSVASEVLCGMGTHPTNFVSTYPGFYTQNAAGAVWFGSQFKVDEFKDVSIGSDVWIASRAIIFGGVKIGHGAIVAAGSVVTKDVPDYAIVAGVPAKLIRYRFSENLIHELIESKWWELPHDLLVQKSFLMNDPEKFIAEVKNIRNHDR